MRRQNREEISRKDVGKMKVYFRMCIFLKTLKEGISVGEKECKLTKRNIECI